MFANFRIVYANRTHKFIIRFFEIETCLSILNNFFGVSKDRKNNKR